MPEPQSRASSTRDRRKSTAKISAFDRERRITLKWDSRTRKLLDISSIDHGFAFERRPMRRSFLKSNVADSMDFRKLQSRVGFDKAIYVCLALDCDFDPWFFHMGTLVQSLSVEELKEPFVSPSVLHSGTVELEEIRTRKPSSAHLNFTGYGHNHIDFAVIIATPSPSASLDDEAVIAWQLMREKSNVNKQSATADVADEESLFLESSKAIIQQARRSLLEHFDSVKENIRKTVDDAAKARASKETMEFLRGAVNELRSELHRCESELGAAISDFRSNDSKTPFSIKRLTHSERLSYIQRVAAASKSDAIRELRQFVRDCHGLSFESSEEYSAFVAVLRCALKACSARIILDGQSCTIFANVGGSGQGSFRFKAAAVQVLTTAAFPACEVAAK